MAARNRAKYLFLNVVFFISTYSFGQEPTFRIYIDEYDSYKVVKFIGKSIELPMLEVVVFSPDSNYCAIRSGSSTGYYLYDKYGDTLNASKIYGVKLYLTNEGRCIALKFPKYKMYEESFLNFYEQSGTKISVDFVFRSPFQLTILNDERIMILSNLESNARAPNSFYFSKRIHVTILDHDFKIIISKEIDFYTTELFLPYYDSLHDKYFISMRNDEGIKTTYVFNSELSLLSID